MPMLVVDKISKRFGENVVLNDVSFAIDAGERVALTGPGGCGKTTILKILLGLMNPDQGHASILGVDLNKASSKDRQETLKRVGMAFQQGGLFDFMTVEENLAFAIQNMTDLDPETTYATIRKLLAGVKLPQTAKLYPHELSGGMKRRVGIARALGTEPDVAIFDEPTAGLDPVTSSIILNMILDLAGEGGKKRAMLVSTSNVEIAIRFADRIIVIHEGTVVADGPWRMLLVEGSPWVRNFLGTRFIGLSLDYAHELHLPQAFIDEHWAKS